jgi:pyruvate formate lyase activating enzyme
VLNPKVKAALSCADLVMLDIKHNDALAYQTLTGGSLETNRSFLDHCREHGIALWIRQVILPGWKTTPQDSMPLPTISIGA